MAGGFAHEMRNALASAKLYLHLAYKESGGGMSGVCLDIADNVKDALMLAYDHMPANERDRAMDLISCARENGNRLMTIFRGLTKDVNRSLMVTDLVLDYSRKGYEQAGKDPIALGGLIDSIVSNFEMEFSQNHISAVVEKDSDCVVCGNERHFYSILSNIIANARDAVIETTGRARLVRIKLMRQDDGGTVLQVVDNGTGIAPKHSAMIFEPFFSTKPNSGTGLGLGIVEKLVSLYDGSIEIDSECGQGTTVSIRLPQKLS
jgi:signal transduction histidine kinase